MNLFWAFNRCMATAHSIFSAPPRRRRIHRPRRRRFREGFARVLGENGSINFLKMIVFIAAIDSVKFSSKSELSSRFFGRLKFLYDDAGDGDGDGDDDVVSLVSILFSKHSF